MVVTIGSSPHGQTRRPPGVAGPGGRRAGWTTGGSGRRRGRAGWVAGRAGAWRRRGTRRGCRAGGWSWALARVGAVPDDAAGEAAAGLVLALAGLLQVLAADAVRGGEGVDDLEQVGQLDGQGAGVGGVAAGGGGVARGGEGSGGAGRG